MELKSACKSYKKSQYFPYIQIVHIQQRNIHALTCSYTKHFIFKTRIVTSSSATSKLQGINCRKPTENAHTIP